MCNYVCVCIIKLGFRFFSMDLSKHKTNRTLGLILKPKPNPIVYGFAFVT